MKQKNSMNRRHEIPIPGAILILTGREITDNIPPGLYMEAIRRGKGVLRRRQKISRAERRGIKENDKAESKIVKNYPR